MTVGQRPLRKPPSFSLSVCQDVRPTRAEAIPEAGARRRNTRFERRDLSADPKTKLGSWRAVQILYSTARRSQANCRHVSRVFRNVPIVKASSGRFRMPDTRSVGDRGAFRGVAKMAARTPGDSGFSNHDGPIQPPSIAARNEHGSCERNPCPPLPPQRLASSPPRHGSRPTKLVHDAVMTRSHLRG